LLCLTMVMVVMETLPILVVVVAMMLAVMVG
jgi:hypothetical protein